MTYVYDAGALIAAERSDRVFARIHQRALQHRQPPVVPAAVLAQVWAGSARQALLSRVLDGCDIEPLTERHARVIGQLRVKSRISDVVDICVVEIAMRRALTIVTSDPKDIQAIIDGAQLQVPDVQLI